MLYFQYIYIGKSVTLLPFMGRIYSGIGNCDILRCVKGLHIHKSFRFSLLDFFSK